MANTRLRYNSNAPNFHFRLNVNLREANLAAKGAMNQQECQLGGGVAPNFSLVCAAG